MFEFNATLIVGIFSFVVFMIIMNAIFYRPILDIIKKRDAIVENNYNEAKELTKTRQKYDTEYDEKLLSAKEENRQKFVAELDNIQKLFTEEINKAKSQAKDFTQNEKEKLLQQKEQLINSLDTNFVDDISNLITSKMIK